MEFAEALPFLESNHRGVVTTYKRSGAAQMSILLCGPYRGTMSFVVQGSTAKRANLKRDPRCAVLTVKHDWSGYVVVTGQATVHDWDNTDPEELRVMLREAFSACGGEHSDWEEYDRVMKAEQRAVVMVHPEHVSGTRT